MMELSTQGEESCHACLICATESIPNRCYKKVVFLSRLPVFDLEQCPHSVSDFGGFLLKVT